MYFSEIPKIKRLSDEFQNQKLFISHFDSWYPELEGYVNENFLPENYKLPGASTNISMQFFNEKMTQYLFSPRGSKYKSDFVFENSTNLKCGEPAPPIKVTTKSHQPKYFIFISLEKNLRCLSWSLIIHPLKNLVNILKLWIGSKTPSRKSTFQVKSIKVKLIWLIWNLIDFQEKHLQCQKLIQDGK